MNVRDPLLLSSSPCQARDCDDSALYLKMYTYGTFYLSAHVCARHAAKLDMLFKKGVAREESHAAV